LFLDKTQANYKIFFYQNMCKILIFNEKILAKKKCFVYDEDIRNIL